MRAVVPGCEPKPHRTPAGGGRRSLFTQLMLAAQTPAAWMDNVSQTFNMKMLTILLVDS